MLCIKADATAGDSIEQVSVEMLRLANLSSACIELSFNGITCLAFPGGIAQSLVDQYYAIAKAPEPSPSKPSIRIATTRARRPR